MKIYKIINLFGEKFFIASENSEIQYFLNTDIESSLIKNGFEKSIKGFENIEKQLTEYALGKRKTFDIHIYFNGTDFQKKVWEKLLKIPYGQTVSYLEIARQLGDKNKVRAVGNAIGKNNITILIPCHRVIGTDKELHGFRGGIKLKQKLLDLEGVKL